MKHLKISTDDMLNGDGLRVVLWVSGCQHQCLECHNPVTWNAEIGAPFDLWEEAELFKLLSEEHIAGVTFTGGDPLYPANRTIIGELARKVKEMGKNVWFYTGYTLELKDGKFIFTDEVTGLEPFEYEYLEFIDVLVDGRYDCQRRKDDIFKNADPHWRGSSNQKLIDIQKSIKHSRIIKYISATSINRKLLRNVFFGEGMTDSMIVRTDATREFLETFCKTWVEYVENGGATVAMMYEYFAEHDYYCEVLFDSEIDKILDDECQDKALDIEGAEFYDFSEYCENTYKRTKGE